MENQSKKPKPKTIRIQYPAAYSPPNKASPEALSPQTVKRKSGIKSYSDSIRVVIEKKKNKETGKIVQSPWRPSSPRDVISPTNTKNSYHSAQSWQDKEKKAGRQTNKLKPARRVSSRSIQIQTPAFIKSSTVRPWLDEEKTARQTKQKPVKRASTRMLQSPTHRMKAASTRQMSSPTFRTRQAPYQTQSPTFRTRRVPSRQIQSPTFRMRRVPSRQVQSPIFRMRRMPSRQIESPTRRMQSPTFRTRRVPSRQVQSPIRRTRIRALPPRRLSPLFGVSPPRPTRSNCCRPPNKRLDANAIHLKYGLFPKKPAPQRKTSNSTLNKPAVNKKKTTPTESFIQSVMDQNSVQMGQNLITKKRGLTDSYQSATMVSTFAVPRSSCMKQPRSRSQRSTSSRVTFNFAMTSVTSKYKGQ
ncbi:salivary glue protein Sgs-3-like isoform X2 [Plodia interpunctella]|uniref:salivary glue protein Sgs-3-like isoform X2 n=1 Tax=Plodia interpunctella TaxID=58824 RepID=UPI0023679727|nr:salivary glue protein Sgs-3-like isoform X2 [Plodia interpunctella]